jgi:hypothetical protein
VKFEYPQTPREVAELLQDATFLRHRSELAGESNIDVQVVHTEAGVRVTVAREKTVEVPAFARIAVGSARRAVENTLWRAEGERWLADYTIAVEGLPAQVRGHSVLEPSPRGCRYTSSFEVTVRIPLIGGRIEALVADGLEEQLRHNAERNADALARSSGQRAAHSFIAGLRGEQDSSRSGGSR